MEEGKAVFGSMVMSPPPAAVAPGKTAKMFVRPYDLDIRLSNDGASDLLGGRIQRIQAASSVVKLEILTDGDNGQPLHVELPHSRFRELNLATGQQVYAVPRDAKIFLEDYTI